MTLQISEALLVQLDSDHEGLDRFSTWILSGKKENLPMRSFGSGRGRYSGLWLPEHAGRLLEFAQESGEKVLVTVWGEGKKGDSALDDKDRPIQPTRPYTRDDAHLLRRRVEQE